MMPRRILCRLIISAALFMAAPAGADILKYTDEDGNVHFTNTPAMGNYVVYIKVPKQRPVLTSKMKGGYRKAIDAAANKNGLDPKLIRSVIMAESNFDPDAVSMAGARGLMQLMPATALRYNVQDVHNPMQNIEGGAKYFKHLLKRYEGDVKLALAAYNAGEEAVKKYSGIPPYPETRNYIQKVLSYYNKMPGEKMPLVRKIKIYRYRRSDGTLLLTDTPITATDDY